MRDSLCITVEVSYVWRVVELGGVWLWLSGVWRLDGVAVWVWLWLVRCMKTRWSCSCWVWLWLSGVWRLGGVWLWLSGVWRLGGVAVVESGCVWSGVWRLGGVAVVLHEAAWWAVSSRWSPAHSSPQLHCPAVDQQHWWQATWADVTWTAGWRWPQETRSKCRRRQGFISTSELSPHCLTTD